MGFLKSHRRLTKCRPVSHEAELPVQEAKSYCVGTATQLPVGWVHHLKTTKDMMDIHHLRETCEGMEPASI